MTADKGYGSDTFREFSANKDGKSVISKRNYNNTLQVKVDWYLYRHLVENNFEKLNTAEQYKKLAKNYANMVSLAFTLMWLPCIA